MKRSKAFDTRRLVLLALLTTIVVILQLLGSFIRFGVFSVSLVLLPIVVGAALTGAGSGGWLGLFFGIAVLASGDAGVFLSVNAMATVAIVLLKGVLAGIAAGALYKAVSGKSKTLAVLLAAAICPIINTGVFVIGAYLFFMPTISGWAASAKFANGTEYLFFGMVGLNFIFELALNLVLSPAIVRLIQYGQSRRIEGA